MSILVDWQIRELCLRFDGGVRDDPLIFPYSETVSGGGVVSYGESSAGFDLRLGREIFRFRDMHGEPVDVRLMNDAAYRERMYDRETYADGDVVVIPARDYVLGVTLERFVIPPNLLGVVLGKSTLARVGILINCTPLEPMWRGHLTVEIGNVGKNPVKLRVGEGIAQLLMLELAAVPKRTYADKGGRYQNQVGVTPAFVR